jgi:hypothetical protein
MKKRLIFICAAIWIVCIAILAGVLWSGNARVADTDPEQQRIRDLIVQLGFEQWHKRVEATEELKKIGEPALPLLVLVKNSRDNEVRPRVRSIIRHILAPYEDAERLSWQFTLLRQLEARGIKPPADFIANIANLQAPAPPAPDPMQNVEPPPPIAPPPIQDGLGALGPGGGMNIDPMQAARGLNPGNGMLGGLMGGGLGGGLGGLMGGMGGGMGGGMLGNLMQMTRQAQAIGIARAQAQQGGPAANNPIRQMRPPDQAQLQNMSLNLLDSVGVRLTEAQEGLRVTDVRPGSPASKAGIRPGDILTKADGRQLARFDDARETIVGKSVKLDLLRREEPLQLELRQ